MFNDLKRFFIYENYKEMNTNSNQIVILFKENMDAVDVLVLNDLKYGTELTKEQYSHIIWQVEQSFYKRGYHRVTILSLLCTNNPERVKDYCTSDKYTHWIIDIAARRLLVYENQQNYYPAISRKIEQFLSMDQSNPNMDTRNQAPVSHESFGKQVKRLWLKYPVITGTLVIVNMLVFFVMELAGLGNDVYVIGGTAYYPVVEEHEYYRLITSMFLHGGWDHLINNMLVLAIIGERLETLLGKTRFTVVYFLTGLMSSIGSVLFYHWMGENVVSVGASGAIFGVIGGIFYLVLRYKGRLNGMTSSRMMLFVVLSLFSGVGNSSAVDNVAHIVGFVSGILITCIIDFIRNRKKVR